MPLSLVAGGAAQCNYVDARDLTWLGVEYATSHRGWGEANGAFFGSYRCGEVLSKVGLDCCSLRGSV